MLPQSDVMVRERKAGAQDENMASHWVSFSVEVAVWMDVVPGLITSGILWRGY